MLKEEIYDRVQKALDTILKSDAKLTKASLAKELGWSATKFSELLGGRMKPGLDLISNLVSKRKVSPDWILTGDGGMFEGQKSGVPLIPLEAVAGNGTFAYDDLPIEDYYNVTEFHSLTILPFPSICRTPLPPRALNNSPTRLYDPFLILVSLTFFAQACSGSFLRRDSKLLMIREP